MPDRVLSTETARTTIATMKGLVSGELTNHLSELKSHGQTLSDPSVWDGNEAARFRDETWPQLRTGLDGALQALHDLQERIGAITANIMVAGGNN